MKRNSPFNSEEGYNVRERRHWFCIQRN